MDPDDLLQHIGLLDPSRNISDMKKGNSLVGPFDGQRVQPNQRPSSTWTTPIEAVSVTEHTTTASVNSHEMTEALQETDIDKLNSGDDDLTPPRYDHMQTVYDAYHASYADPISEESAHMQRATDLALALLQRHCPESQGYIVEPAALGPYSAKGINFMLKELKEPDSDPDTPPPQKLRRVAKMTLKHYSYSAPWHYIPPERMAALVVKQRTSEVDEGIEMVTYRTHTCLVVILDDLATLHRWSRANLNHRGDVLSDVLGAIGGVARGHGILLFGPRLELYNYDANNDDTPVTPCTSLGWKMDMRTTSLAAVDEVLRDFAQQEVVHRDCS